MDKPDILNRTGRRRRTSGQPWHFAYVAVRGLGKRRRRRVLGWARSLPHRVTAHACANSTTRTP